MLEQPKWLKYTEQDKQLQNSEYRQVKTELTSNHLIGSLH